MAVEQHRVVIGLAINENGAVAQATAIEERIRGIFSRLNAASTKIGGLDDSGAAAQQFERVAQRFGSQLRNAVTQAMAVDVRNSPLFQSMSTQLQGLTRVGGVHSITDSPSSVFMESRLRQVQAELARMQHQAKAAIPVGEKGGYRDTTALLKAEASTALGIERANKAIERQKLEYIADFGRAVSNEIRATQRAAETTAAAARREEEARGRAIVAINRRTAAEEAATTRYISAFGRNLNLALRQQEDEKAAAQRRLDTINQAHYRRIMAEDAAARAAEAAAKADRDAAAFRATYASPDLTTSVGRAQAGVNRAEAALDVATRSLATLRASETRTAQQIIASESRVASASSALAAAREKLATAEASAAGSVASGSLRQQFMTGFHGRGDRTYAEQIGQAFKFSVFYGTAYKLLFAFTATLQQTLQEGIEFQQAVTELKLAAGRAEEEVTAMADQLGQRSVEAGFAPSAGVIVGARSLGLYGATDAPLAEQERIADMSARIVSRLAFSSGMQPADLQTNIAAITNAFGGGPEAQFRVADLDAYMAHEFGVAPGATIQTVSESGTVGAAAGYSQEEVYAIAANLMARTGQTAPAVAGFMAQIFSRGGEGTLTNVAQRYGVDPTLELSEQIARLAAIYQEATPQERSVIGAAFGRGKVQGAAVALLQDYDSVVGAAEEARGGAAEGAFDKAFQARMNNIGGQIQLTMGVLKEFANQLGQSGVLDALGLAILFFRELVEAGTGLLRLWNELDGPMKAAIAAFIALAAITRSQAAAGALSAVGSRFMAGYRGPAAGPGFPQVSTYPGGFGIRNAGGVPQPFNQLSGMRALGYQAARAPMALARGTAEVLGLASPAALAVGGLLAIGALKGTSDRLRAAQDAASDALATPALSSTATVDDYRSRASAMAAAGADAEQQASGIMPRLLFWQRGDLLDSAGQLEQEADRLNRAAELVEAAAAANTGATTQLITDFDADSLGTSLGLIASNGGTAQEQLEALRSALLGTADAAATAADQFDPEHFAATSAAGLSDAIAGVLGDSKTVGIGEGATVSGGDINERLRAALSNTDIEGMLAAAGQDWESLEDLSGKEATRLAEQMAGQIEGGLDHYGLGFMKGEYVKAIRAYLLAQSEGVRDIIRGGAVLSDSQLTATIQNFVATGDAAVQAMQETDYRGRIQQAQQTVRNIRMAIRHSASGGTPFAFEQLDAARRMLAQAQFNELEAMRRAAQQNARSRAEVARIGRGFLRRELRAAIRGGNSDLLAEIIGQAGAGAIRIARQIIQEAINAARAANQVRLQMLQLQREAQGAISELDFVRGGQGPGLQPSISDEQQQMLDTLNTAVTAGSKEDNVYISGSDVPGYKPPPSADAAEKAARDRETALERQAALAAANAIRSESSIGAARAEMLAARAAMAEAKKGTVAYYDALGQYYAARNSLTDAILDYRNNQFLLNRDVTDPVVQARAALRAAQAKLRSDRGKGEDVLAADRLAVKQAEAEREAAAFSKRLEAIQTAEQLGRISHQRYINYLENESRRLNRIKDRTYQQQQQLNQIDQLLQEAASAMDAQWNFGDIRLPTPYQVRRYIEETSPDRGADTRGSSVNNTTTIYIDGADTGAVKRIINQHVGQHARVLTTAPRRR